MSGFGIGKISVGNPNWVQSLFYVVEDIDLGIPVCMAVVVTDQILISAIRIAGVTGARNAGLLAKNNVVYLKPVIGSGYQNAVVSEVSSIGESIIVQLKSEKPLSSRPVELRELPYGRFPRGETYYFWDSSQNLVRTAEYVSGNPGEPMCLLGIRQGADLVLDGTPVIQQGAVVGIIFDHNGPDAIFTPTAVLRSLFESLERIITRSIPAEGRDLTATNTEILDEDSVAESVANPEAEEIFEEIFTEEQQVQSSLSSEEPLHVEPGALSDRDHTGPDLLHFADYAAALSEFIKHPNTGTPLTLCIDAPWGMGKTRLMQMIREEVRKSEFPTIWFDAWKHDRPDGALWAALALEVVEQTEKEYYSRHGWLRGWLFWLRFWFTLNRSRFDWRKFGGDVARIVGTTLAVFLIGAFVYDIAVIRGVAVDKHEPTFDEFFSKYGVIGIYIAIFLLGRAATKQLAEVFPHKLNRYLAGPDYEEKVGFIHKFNEDFASIVGSVTEEGAKPLVVFVDDLDRCAPAKAAEVVEAVNILLST